MKRLEHIPNGPPKPGSNLPVPDWAKPELLPVPAKLNNVTADFSQPLDGVIPEISPELPFKTIGLLVLTLVIAVIMAAILQHLMP